MNMRVKQQLGMVLAKWCCRGILPPTVMGILFSVILLSSAQAQVTAESLNAHVVETAFSVDRTNCIPTDRGEACYHYMEYHLMWSRDVAFPLNPPSPTGYWTGFAWMFSDTTPWIIVGMPGQYFGTAHVLTSIGQFTEEEAQAIRSSVFNRNYRVFSYFITPEGTQIGLESNPGLTYLAMGPEPDDPEITPSPEHNGSCVGDPVYLHSGQFFYQCDDFSVPGRQLNVELAHTYYSGMSFNGPFGYGWMLNYYMRLHTIQGGDVVIVSGDGRKTRYTFDGSAYIPPPGRFESLAKNPDSSWTLTAANGDQRLFDTDGKLVAIKDRNNNTISLVYDTGKQPYYGKSKFAQDPLNSVVIGSDYRLVQIVDTAGRTVSLTYNADGLLEKIIDGSREVAFSYDAATNDLLSVTKPATPQFPAGVTKSFEYESHNVKRIKDAKSQYFVENFYDAQGRVQQQNLGGHNLTFDYSVVDQVTETDRKGFESVYTFNAAGNMVKREERTNGLRLNDPLSFVTAYAYNADSLKTSETFPKGNGIKYVYDSANPNPRSRGNLLQLRRKTDMTAADNDTNDLVTAMSYESLFNQIDTVTDPKGNTTAYTYDHELNMAHSKYGTKGNLIFIDQPVVPAGTPTTEFSYNNFGQVTQTIDPNGNITQYAYDPVTGYLRDIYQDPSGINAHTHFTYDVFGNLNLVTDANNHATDYDYDALGWLNKVTNPLGYVTKHTYDANGNIIKTERQADETATAWQTTEFTYDILNKLKTVNDPLNRVTTYNYDANENLASVVDAELNAANYVYDERDLLFTVTDANTPAGVTTYGYDLNGNLEKITDANGNPTAYTHDLFDRLDTMNYADGSVVDYAYDKNSNLDFVTLPGIHGTIDYVYDGLNRLTNKNFPNNPSHNITYIYDLGSRLTDANNSASDAHFTYDTLNRVDTTTQTINATLYTLDYAYEDNGNLSKLIYPSTKTINYTYDGNDRLDLVKVGATTLVDYNYDPLDRRNTKTFASLSPQQQTDYTFDIANQLAAVTNKVLPSANISTHAYPLYDAVGNRKQYDRTFQANPTATINYGYNDIYELATVTGAQTNSYDYDLVGNRELADGVSYTPNNLNQYTNVGGNTLLYDNNGNVTFDGAGKNFTYDELNRLLTFSDGITNASYTYDAFNRRVSKTVNGVTTYFIYDDSSVVAEYDGTGALNSEYVLGDQVDEVLTMERGGNIYYYHHDGLGSVTEITDSAGSISENYTYDAYGNASLINSIVGNPYRFTGQEFDEETGLHHYNRRTYSSELGRFMQRDPIGYEDGMNLFTYVHNNPLNYIDPYGLDTYYINNWINFDDTPIPVWGPISHSFVAVTDLDPKTGKQVVTETYSWVATNGGEWEPLDREKNIKGAQAAIDKNIGIEWRGGEDLDPYVMELFREKQNETGGFWGSRGVCKVQANRLIKDAIKKKKAQDTKKSKRK